MVGNKTEDWTNPGSFAYLMRQIMGAKCDRELASQRLGISETGLGAILNGWHVPTRSYVEGWPDLLHPYYNLDRICDGDTLTLREKFANKVASLALTKGRSVIDNPDIAALVWEISGRRPDYVVFLGQVTALPPQTLRNFMTNPHTYSPRWVEINLIPKLREACADKYLYVEQLRITLLAPRTSAAKIKSNIKKVQAEFRESTGMLLREMREACGLTAADIAASTTTLVLKDKSEKLERGDEKLPTTIFRAGIREYRDICKRRAPEIAKPYLPTLKILEEYFTLR